MDLDTNTAVDTPIDTQVMDAPTAETPAEPQSDTDLFADIDFNEAFGLPAEDAPGQTADTPLDVPVVTEPPVPRQDVELKKEEAVDAAVPVLPKDDTKETGLNWETAPKEFRKQYDALKAEYLAKTENDLGAKYLSNPTEFQKWMQEASPTSYREIGQLVATESAQKHPEQWLEYFLNEQPDLVAQIVTGEKGLTMEKLKAERELLLDGDADNLAAIEERRKAESAKTAPAEKTPEQKRIDAILARDEQREVGAITTEVFSPIEEEIDGLVSAAGLEIKESDYKGKNFADLDEDTKFKMVVNELLPVWIDMRVKQNPAHVNMQKRLTEFIEAKDKTSALGMQHAAKILASNYASEFLEVVTGHKAKKAQSETASPTKELPPPIVKSTGNGHQPKDEPWDSKTAFSFTEDDLTRIGK